MNTLMPRLAGIVLCLLMLSASVACSDEPGLDSSEAREGTEQSSNADDPGVVGTDIGKSDDHGLVLEGHLVPSGGMSMSNSFTLSGELTPNVPATPSSSDSFVLEETPPMSAGDRADERP